MLKKKVYVWATMHANSCMEDNIIYVNFLL